MASGFVRSRGAALRDRSIALVGFVLAGLLVALAAIAIVALVVHAPLAGVLGALFRPVVQQALVVSFETTLVSAVVIALAGTPLALVLARSFPGRDALEAFVSLPVVLPPIVAGLALLLAFGRMGLLGHALSAWGIEVPFSMAAVVLAQTLVAAPLYVIAAKNAFERIDPDMLDAAATLRASPAYTALRVVLPPALPALGAALALAWARALGEFGATITFAGNLPGVTQTMPIAVYVSGQSDLDAAIAIALVLVFVSLAVLLGARLLRARTLAP
jgi:molybdate transport system permease protein